MWVTTGARWSGMTTTWRPFGRVKSVILGALAATGVMAPAAFATRASAASVVRVLRKALVLPNDDARIVAGGLAKHLAAARVERNPDDVRSGAVAAVSEYSLPRGLRQSPLWPFDSWGRARRAGSATASDSPPAVP